MTTSFKVTLIICIGCLILVSLFFTVKAVLKVKAIDEGKYDKKIIDEINHPKKSPWFLLLFKILGWVVVGLLALMFLSGIVHRINSSYNPHFQMVMVPTGSMSYKNEANTYLEENDINNQFPANSLVALVKVDSIEDVKKYDVLCYAKSDGTQIIHRVIDIDEDGLMTLRGDANNANDPEKVAFSQVVGKYNNFYIPYVGSAVTYIQSNEGITVSVTVILSLLVWDFSDSFPENKYEERKEKLSNSNSKEDDD